MSTVYLGGRVELTVMETPDRCGYVIVEKKPGRSESFLDGFYSSYKEAIDARAKIIEERKLAMV